MNLDVRSILGEDGRIAHRLPTYEPRPQQLEMAQAVEQAIRTQSHLVVEAGTGVGKSFAYLVPAILSINEAQSAPATPSRRRDLDDDDFDDEPEATGKQKRRVVIATHTIALQ